MNKSAGRKTVEGSSYPGLRHLFRDRYSVRPSVVALIGISLIVGHLLFFAATTHQPDSQAVEYGVYQRDMAAWYVPMRSGAFDQVPSFSRTRWLTPLLAGGIPIGILKSFQVVTMLSLAGSALILLNLMIRMNFSLSGIVAGIIIFMWSYACRYALFNPFVPDGFRYFSIMLLLAGAIKRRPWLIWAGSILAAINHESALLFLPVAVIPLLADVPLKKRWSKLLFLAGPGFLLYFANRLLMNYLYPSDQVLVSRRFLGEEVLKIIDKQGGITGVMYLSYSALGPLLTLFALALINIPVRWRVMSLLWTAVTMLQLLLASDTLRMVQALLPLCILMIIWGLSERLRSSPWLWNLMLVFAVTAHITKSISRFDTRSALAPKLFNAIPGDWINVLILIPFLFLILMILRSPIPCRSTESDFVYHSH